MAAARDWSLRRVDEIRRRLLGIDRQATAIRSLVMTGSLARLDACPESDGDLIVVLHDEVAPDSQEATEAVHAIWRPLESLGLRPPKAGGIYRSPTSGHQLCSGRRGVVEESREIFGKRIQLLLEARSVLGQDACTALQRDILQRYAEHPFAARPGELWSYLTDDLIRYWRSYRVWRQWDTSPDNGGWYVRNLKLAHGRRLSYASLLLSCLRCACPEVASVEPLLAFVGMTPLERLWSLDQEIGAGVFDGISGCYERYLHTMHDAQVRRKLGSCTPSSPQRALREAPEEFTDLLDNAEQLRAALVRLVRALAPADSDDRLASVIL